MKDKNTKIIEQSHNDGMHKYRVTSNGYHQNRLHSKSDINKDK